MCCKMLDDLCGGLRIKLSARKSGIRRGNGMRTKKIRHIKRRLHHRNMRAITPVNASGDSKKSLLPAFGIRFFFFWMTVVITVINVFSASHDATSGKYTIPFVKTIYMIDDITPGSL